MRGAGQNKTVFEPPINLQDDASETLIFQIKRLMLFNKSFTAHLSVDTLAERGRGGQDEPDDGVDAFTQSRRLPFSTARYLCWGPPTNPSITKSSPSLGEPPRRLLMLAWSLVTM